MVVVPPKMVGKWFKQAFNSFDTDIPIDERRNMAIDVVFGKMDAYERTIPLTTFLKKKTP